MYSLPAVILGLTVHEFSHAYAAYKLGDDTAKLQGRLTLNPLQHIDLLGFIFIVFAEFGWAKPVQFVPDKLKSPRKDKVLIALAGPISNLLVGILFIFAIKIFLPFSGSLPEAQSTIFFNLLLYITYNNLGLFIFNILPLPPLDGSHVFFSGINIPIEKEEKIRRYGSYALFFILIIESSAKIDIIPIGKLTNFIVALFF